eukprot:15460739-Alexandrium_andersonii.AAC.1
MSERGPAGRPIDGRSRNPLSPVVVSVRVVPKSWRLAYRAVSGRLRQPAGAECGRQQRPAVVWK